MLRRFVKRLSLLRLRIMNRIKNKPRRSREEILSEIKKLISTKGYIYALAEILSQDFFVDTRDVANINWRARLHNNEFALLMGLMLKTPGIDFQEISKREIAKAIKHTRTLLDELHWTYNYDFGSRLAAKADKIGTMTEADKRREFEEIFGSKDMIIESTFYGDSGYYDVQCFELAPKLYQQDAEWLANKTAFDIAKAHTIYRAINELTNAMHYGRGHEDEFARKSIPESAPPMRAIDEFAFPLGLIVKSTKRLDKNVSEKEIKEFLDMFSCVAGDQLESFNEPGDENIYTYKPIIKFSDKIYFLPNKMFLAAAIYKSPLYWMRQDADYADTANKHIGDIAEDITYDYFVKIFGKKNVYKHIDIYKSKNRLTDIDVMAVLGNTVVIAQNKSKKMTLSALAGDAEAIRTDFKKAVIDPYKQGIKVRDTILGNESYKLIDDKGQQITLPQGIEHAYILCVSNEPYPAVMTQMRTFLTNVDQLPPMQISLFDLDLMAEYLQDPYEFVFYIKQRLENHEGILSENEIIHLAFHLKYGLFMPKDSNMLSLDESFGQLLDADYYHRKMGTPKPKDKDALLPTWKNEAYDKIIEMVKKLGNPMQTDIIFFLMTIPHDIVDTITEYIGKVNELAGKDNGYHDFSMPIENNGKPWGGITYIAGSSLQGILKRLEVITEINKYRAKADTWLAIGARSDGIIGIIAFNNKPWKQAKDMDEALDFYQKHTHGRQIKIDRTDDEME